MKGLATILLVLAAPAAAQIVPQINCMADDLSGPEYRFCASEAYEVADAEMNEAYRLVITRAKVFDEEAASEGLAVPLTLEEALRQAQRDWVAFRDSDCDAIAVTFRGGTGAPVAGTLCRAEKTVARTDDLRRLLADL